MRKATGQAQVPKSARPITDDIGEIVRLRGAGVEPRMRLLGTGRLAFASPMIRRDKPREVVIERFEGTA
jgi:hypothetical protein